MHNRWTKFAVIVAGWLFVGLVLSLEIYFNNRASMKGMVVFDYASRYGEAAREMAGWMAAGQLKSREDIVDGLATFPETLSKLFKGENTGKLVLKVADA